MPDNGVVIYGCKCMYKLYESVNSQPKQNQIDLSHKQLPLTASLLFFLLLLIRALIRRVHSSGLSRDTLLLFFSTWIRMIHVWFLYMNWLAGNHPIRAQPLSKTAESFYWTFKSPEILSFRCFCLISAGPFTQSLGETSLPHYEGCRALY